MICYSRLIQREGLYLSIVARWVISKPIPGFNLRFSLCISYMCLPAIAQRASIWAKDILWIHFPRRIGNISSGISNSLKPRLYAQVSKFENIAIRVTSDDGHCKIRCLTSSGAARSHGGQLLVYSGRCLSLISSAHNRLAWHTRRAIVSHILINSGFFLDKAHHVRYFGLLLIIPLILFIGAPGFNINTYIQKRSNASSTYNPNCYGKIGKMI